MSSPTRLRGSRRRPLLALAAVVVLVASTSACATTRAVRDARAAETRQDYARAVIEYENALRQRPDDRTLQLALDRAKLRAAEAHFHRGRRLASIGRLEEALVELQIAAELNPAHGEIEDQLRATRLALRTKVAVAREGKTRLQTLTEAAREFAAPGLDLPEDLKLPSSLIFPSASARDVIIALARFADMNVVFDPTFRDTPLTIDLRNVTFQDALTSITASTRTFYRLTGPRTLVIVPDTPAKRREYEEEIVRTFYLSNADLKETIDLLRIVIDARRIAGVPATNAITIKDSPERVAAASRVITAIDKARPEVVIHVELLEVDRTRLREFGLQIASPGSPGIDGVADVNRQRLTLRDLRALTQADVLLANVPGLYYRLLKTDSNTRTLANPQLRTTEGVPAQARFGERVPVPVTTFSPIATGGVATQPITSFNYENIGVNIDITPRTHHDDDVSLTIKLEVSSISGTGFGGLPTFGNRSISTVIRLRDGETNMLAGLIRDDERRVLEGVPGLSDLPFVGRLFARNRREAQETDIILTLTPHVVRVLDLTEADLRPFRVGRQAGAPVVEMPMPIDTPPRDGGLQAPDVDTPDPGAPPRIPPGPRPIGPVLPPSPEPPGDDDPGDPQGV
jgi:general secretion pathway protein D